MGKTVNFKKTISVIISVFMMLSMTMSFTVEAADSLETRALIYSAGDVDGIQGASEVRFNKVINTTFDAADASRFSRLGYTLTSWYVPSTGETVKLSAQYKMPEHDITFVANWTPAVYDVSFAGKGGRTAENKTTVTSTATYGTSITLPENPFTYNDYYFAGWKYDNVIYSEGEQFEVPALMSGKKIVFSAVWSADAPVTTTAPTVTEPVVTTAYDESVKTYPINAALQIGDIYQIPLDEILSAGVVEKLDVNLRTYSDIIGQVSMAFGTNSNGQWYNVDYSEYINSNVASINFGTPEICNNLDGDSLQVSFWWGQFTPIYVDSLTVKYDFSKVKETTVTTTAYYYSETTTTTATTANIFWTEPETTTTTTDFWFYPETTTTTDFWAYPETTTTSYFWTQPETTATESYWTTVATDVNKSQYSKVVDINEYISRGSMLVLPSEKLISANQIIDSVELTFRTNYGTINNYSMSVSVEKNDYLYEQVDFNEFRADNRMTLSVKIPEESQAYVVSDNLVSIGYWWGDTDGMVLESVKVNYSIKVGDYNHDGVVGADDIDALRKYMVGTIVYGYDIDAESADANNDGIVNVFDCMALSRLMN